MLKRKALGIGLCFPLVAAWLYAAKPFPASPRSYVYNEGVVSPAAEARLSQGLAAFEQKTGHQFVVALFSSLEGESLEDYCNRLFRAWKIGDAKRNDGLLFAIFKQDHRWRVEVGYGLESTLTDLEAAEIVRESAVPHFRNGDYDGGVAAAVDGLTARLAGTAPVKSRGSATSNWTGITLIVIIIFLLKNPWILVLLIFLLQYLLSRRRHYIGGSYRGGGFYWGGGFGGGGWGGGFGGGGGFSGGGGSSGGGGASGGW